MTERFYNVGFEKIPFPNNEKPKPSLDTQVEGILAIKDRIALEQEALAAQEIKLDGSNKVIFPGFPYKFEALGEKILVAIDVFKSGYECKICKGKKKIKTLCSCEAAGHSGKKYAEEDLQTVRDTLGYDVYFSRLEMPCPDCLGAYESRRSESICVACKGKGALLELPDESKNLPTTGVVVSVGSKVKELGLDYKIGDRIIFGPYAGNAIPTKAGIMLKILDAVQAWAKIEGGQDLAAFDFIIQSDT